MAQIVFTIQEIFSDPYSRMRGLSVDEVLPSDFWTSRPDLIVTGGELRSDSFFAQVTKEIPEGQHTITYGVSNPSAYPHHVNLSFVNVDFPENNGALGEGDVSLSGFLTLSFTVSMSTPSGVAILRVRVAESPEKPTNYIEGVKVSVYQDEALTQFLASGYTGNAAAGYYVEFQFTVPTDYSATVYVAAEKTGYVTGYSSFPLIAGQGYTGEMTFGSGTTPPPPDGDGGTPIQNLGILFILFFAFLTLYFWRK
jgi:hypothetical protein